MFIQGARCSENWKVMLYSYSNIVYANSSVLSFRTLCHDITTTYQNITSSLCNYVFKVQSNCLEMLTQILRGRFLLHVAHGIRYRVREDTRSNLVKIKNSQSMG